MVSNGNVTTVVTGLVDDGLVDKRAAPQDRRVQIISLTPAGRRQFRAMAERHEIWIADLFAGLGTAEIAELMRLLATTKSSLHAALRRAKALEAAE
jgi:DNA-binding MarR family transcriptional regulator